MMTEGWKCPQCLAVMAPWVAYCRNCVPVKAISTSTVSVDCGCPTHNYVCMNVACPRRVKVTC